MLHSDSACSSTSLRNFNQSEPKSLINKSVIEPACSFDESRDRISNPTSNIQPVDHFIQEPSTEGSLSQMNNLSSAQSSSSNSTTEGCYNRYVITRIIALLEIPSPSTSPAPRKRRKPAYFNIDHEISNPKTRKPKTKFAKFRECHPNACERFLKGDSNPTDLKTLQSFINNFYK